LFRDTGELKPQSVKQGEPEGIRCRFVTVFKAAYGFPGVTCPSLKQESLALKFLEIEKKE
jgi:hypothetical protein